MPRTAVSFSPTDPVCPTRNLLVNGSPGPARGAGAHATRARSGRRVSTVLCTVLIANVRQLRTAHLALLDDTERHRADTFARRGDHDRFVLGAALSRLSIADELGIEPIEVLIDRACHTCHRQHGKPRVTGSSVHFSLSHSAELVVVALTRAWPLGVDVEPRLASAPVGLAPRVLSDAEPMSGPEDFTTYWCRKESVVKATGDGLGVALPSVVVSPAYAPPRLLNYQGKALAAAMVDLDLGSAFAGAVTILTPHDTTVTVTSAATLLGVGCGATTTCTPTTRIRAGRPRRPGSA